MRSYEENEMHSFDVFDTLITRRTATPQGIFAIIQKELEQDKEYRSISFCFRTNFCRLRVEAEKLARYTYQNGEIDDVTLRQIYDVFAVRGELNENQIRQMMELECRVEYQESLPIKKNIARLKNLLLNGENIILISDMYLPREQIQKMLEKADPVLKTLPLFLSSECKEGKYTGKLYLRAKKELYLKESKWIHIGDNVRVDGMAAERLGIGTQISWFPELLPIEQELLRKAADNIWINRMIGCSRQSRLLLGETKAKNDAVIVGTSAGGILLFSYVSWILRNCREKKINRLYFIARDGYVLKKIADNIIRYSDLKIKTHYVYGSRRAWRMPSFSARNHDIQKLIDWSHGGSIKCINDIADVFQIPVEKLRQFLTIVISDTMQEISRYTMQKIWKDLQTNRNFVEYLIEYHAAKREMIKQYLKQEIDFSDNQFAFVDVSGSGYTQGCLADIIQDFYEKPIHTFFFKLEKLNITDNCINYCFFPTRIKNGVIIEMFCRAPEEQTVGYQRQGKKVVPVFRENEEEKQAIINHGFEDYMDGIEAFVRQACENQLEYLVEDMEQIYRMLTYVTEMPDPVFMRFLGDMPNSMTGREKKVIAFAPMLTDAEIKKIYLEKKLEEYPNSCLEYSLLRCTAKQLNRIKYYQNLPAPVLLTRDFPYELCCGRIVLYGAGKMGRELYGKMQEIRNITVVQWIDKNAKEYRSNQYPVSGIEELKKEFFEKLVIAVRNKSIARDIKNELREKGILAEKIFWFNPFREWERDFLEEED